MEVEHTGTFMFHVWLPSAARLDKDRDKGTKQTEIIRKKIPFPTSIYLHLECEGMETYEI